MNPIVEWYLIRREKVRAYIAHWVGVHDAQEGYRNLFTYHETEIAALKKTIDEVTQLLFKAVEQLNVTTRGSINTHNRLHYYERHSAILSRLRDEMDREQRKRAREAREQQEATQHLPPGALEPPVVEHVS